ncbi:hypothetical protein D9M70_472720 [compost metagenome]
MGIDFLGTGEYEDEPPVEKEVYQGTNIPRGEIDKIIPWFLSWGAENLTFADMELVQKTRDLVFGDLQDMKQLVKNGTCNGYPNEIPASFSDYARVDPEEKSRKLTALEDLKLDIATYVGDLFFAAAQHKNHVESGDYHFFDLFDFRKDSKLRKKRHEHPLYCDPFLTFEDACSEIEDRYLSASFSGISHLLHDPG